MRMTLLCHQLIITSGQARFLFNLATGLKRIGCEVSVCCLEVDSFYAAKLKGTGIKLLQGKMELGSSLNQLRTILSSAKLSRALARVAAEASPADWQVVLADEALGVVNHLTDRSLAWISCGDLSLMYLYPAFYRTEAMLKRILALGMASSVRTHAAWAGRYDVLLALSNFTRQLMSHLYSLPFQGVVYPPVDTDFFRPVPSPEGDYALAVVRNVREFNLELLDAMAGRMRLRVVGGGRISGAQNIGVVDDERFRDIMAHARLLIFPSPAELFGYPVLECLSCGTPALAFANGGPSEVIEEGRSGWLATSRVDFLRIATEVMSQGYQPEVRNWARERALGFSPMRMAERLLSHLK